jgi:hypothetical protein
LFSLNPVSPLIQKIQILTVVLPMPAVSDFPGSRYNVKMMALQTAADLARPCFLSHCGVSSPADNCPVIYLGIDRCNGASKTV